MTGYSGSLGAGRVRESFNPSQDSLVDKIKRHTADLIDLCEEGNGKASTQEEVRLWALAMTDYERAAMWAVKAATADVHSRGDPSPTQPPLNEPNPNTGVDQSPAYGGTKQPDRD